MAADLKDVAFAGEGKGAGWRGGRVASAVPSSVPSQRAPSRLASVVFIDPNASWRDFVARGGSQLPVRRASTLGSRHAGHTSWPVAVGHLITAIIGAGVLGLPHSLGWMGWVGGVLAMVVFFVITLWCMQMLARCYEVKGRRHTRYTQCVLQILGPRAAVWLSVFQIATFLCTTIAYHIAAAESMGYIAQQICSTAAIPASRCPSQSWVMALIFAGPQLLLSQLPNLESAWWASLMGAAMSLAYSGIAIGLSASKAYRGLGTITGHEASTLNKTLAIFNSLGAIGFAYNCSIVLIEIEDTLHEPPKAEVSMRKVLNLGLSTTFVIYISVACLGYLALGTNVPGDILLGFADAPAWIGILGNMAVLLHMVSAYQVFAQPLFASIEDGLLRCMPWLANVEELVVRLVYRSAYVCFTTLVACVVPFFSAFTGLVGAISYFPTAVLFPILMYSKVHSPSRPWVVCAAVVAGVTGIMAVLAIAGSIHTIASSVSGMRPFQAGGGGHA